MISNHQEREESEFRDSFWDIIPVKVRSGMRYRLAQAAWEYGRSYERSRSPQEQFDEGWQVAHDPASCGHPRACWQDRNYPESERNYDPETRTSNPPIDYRCLMCEQKQRAENGAATTPHPFYESNKERE